jgi:hypothetical protein
MLPQNGGISATLTSKVTASPQKAAQFHNSDKNQFKLQVLGALPTGERSAKVCTDPVL